MKNFRRVAITSLLLALVSASAHAFVAFATPVLSAAETNATHGAAARHNSVAGDTSSALPFMSAVPAYEYSPGADELRKGTYLASLMSVSYPAATTFTVNSIADTNNGACTTTVSGCTLREATNAANANVGADNIAFNLGAGLDTIGILSQLPAITEAVTINGSTVVLNGALAGAGANVLLVAPTLGTYPATTVGLSANITITPSAAPNGVTSMNVSTSAGFNGRFEADAATGVVRLTNAHPAKVPPGAYPVTVRAFGPGGMATQTFMLTVNNGAACGTLQFASNFGVQGDSGPVSLAVGDFNGDGIQDVATANRKPGNISILLGTGTGSFGAASNFAVGDFPTSIAVGDFNGDGIQDLVISNDDTENSNEDADNVSIFLGAGTGSFGAASNFSVGSHPSSVAVGDFNGDGTQDIATANLESANISILLGTGAGGFGAATNFGAGNEETGGPISIAVGDFNGDGIQDVATANPRSNNVSILLGTGTGSFGTATNLGVGSGPNSIVVGNFNGDGIQDVATANLLSENVSILLGTGTGSFGPATNFDVGADADSIAMDHFNQMGEGEDEEGKNAPSSIAVGDFNGDGNQDIAASLRNSDSVSILLGTGTGSFGVASSFEVGGEDEGAMPQSVVVGDFNGDGRQDLATANSGSGNVSVLLRNCATPSPTPTPTPTPTANVSGTKSKTGGISPGSTVTYTVILSNSGPGAQSDNDGSEFVDVLPSSLTLVSATSTDGTATADLPNVVTNNKSPNLPAGRVGSYERNRVTWNGVIPAGGSVTITITATINNVPDGTVVSNQGTISYDSDGNAANDAIRLTDDPSIGGASDPTNFTVTSQPDLTITKSHSGNFSAGQVGATYTITVTNIGTGQSSGLVTVTDNVPVGLTPTGPNSVVNGWTCAINGQTLTCTRSDTLTGGGASYPAINLTVTVANPAPLSVTNTATVSGGGEVNPNNNTASDPTTINCSADFALNNGSPLMISRFRENGPAGPQDEFIEIFNPTPIPHTVASGNCHGGGYGVYASAGDRTTSNTATLVCYIPNGTVIPAGGYYLCTGVTYSLGNLGLNGGLAGATAAGDAPIGCGGTCGANIPDDAGLALINHADPTLSFPAGFGIVEFGDVFYDRVGFGPYVGLPTPAYPFLAPTYCEGGAAGCLKPVGDASTGAACSNPTGLFPVFPILSGPPTCYGLAGQYEFLRRQTTFDANQGTLHQDTNNNGNDFILVAPNPATNMGMVVTSVSGVTAVLGAAGPYNRNAPPDMPAVKLTRSPFDGTNQFGPLNAERRYIPDPTVANPDNNPLGTLTLRVKYTNNSGLPINGVRFEVDNLSTLCGSQTASSTVGTGDARNVGSSPDCGTGAFTAILKALNSTAEVIVDSGGTARSVQGTVLEDLSVGAAPGAGPLSPNGGGIDSTFIINPASANASVGDGVTGGVGNFATTMGTSGPTQEIRVQVKFGVVRNGRFILLLVPMAKPSPTP